MLFANIIEQILLLLPLCVGIYLSFQILKLTDLTTDGSFVLGAGVFARLAAQGYSLSFATVVALLSGMGVGCFVAYIQKDNKVNSLIAGILALFILQSFNLLVMGKPNISLINVVVLPKYIIYLLSLATSFSVLVVLLCSFGLLLRGFGENEALLARFGYKTHTLKTLGLMISNGLAAFSGVLTAQVFNYADLNMGVGVTLTGIGALMVGLYLIQDLNFSRRMLPVKGFVGVVVGVTTYFFLLNLFLRLGINPLYLKLLMGLLLISFLRIRLASHIS